MERGGGREKYFGLKNFQKTEKEGKKTTRNGLHQRK